MGRSVLARAAATRAANVGARRTLHIPLQSPWQGYVPDLAVPTKSPNGLESCKGVVVHSGVLTTDAGWRKLGSSTLPLGHDGDTIGFTDSVGTNYGSGATPAVASQPNDKAQPVRHLAAFQRFKAVSGLGAIETMAVTANTGTIGSGGPPYQETGHLFRRDSTGAWSSIEFDSQNSLGAKVAGSVPLTGSVSDWVDSAVYTLGVTGATVILGTDTRTIRAVAESVFIFTNYRDQLMYYPNVTDGTKYTDFLSYATQISDILGDSDLDFGTTPASIFTRFRCKTLASFDGRMWYGNTVEGSAYYGNRVRRSIVGNPFIIWPGMEVQEGSTFYFSGVGAGYIDFDQFRTPIQRILPLGDLLCVYSRDGIAVVRRTGNLAAPYAIQYLTLDRGLLSPGSVAPINPAQHFAFLNDGWYLISANGTIQEVGITPAGSVLAGPREPNYKWKTTFYTRLNSDAVDAGYLQTNYDHNTQSVRAAVPTAGSSTPREVWIYDIRNDRVFLDDYTSVAGRDQSPTCWGNTFLESSISRSWDEVTSLGLGSWESHTDTGSWESLIVSFGGTVTAHGDVNGYIYTHDHNLDTRDDDKVSWSFTSDEHNFGNLGAGILLLRRVDVQYRNNEASTGESCSVTATTYDNDSGTNTSAGSAVGVSVPMNRGLAGEMAVGFAHFRQSGDHLKVGMSGVGKPYIHSIHLELESLEGRYRGLEP